MSANLPEIYSRHLETSKMEFLVKIVNSIDKSSFLDVAGASSYSENYHPFLVKAQILLW